LPTKKVKTKKESSKAKALAIELARVARDSNCEEIMVLDLRDISPVTEFFVIASGSSTRQLRSVMQFIADKGKELDQKVWNIAGKDSADWILLDFVDVVVHLFDEERRHYYDIELIWGEAKKIDWETD